MRVGEGGECYEFKIFAFIYLFIYFFFFERNL